MLLVGALLGLYIADACREVDEAVRNLPQTGHGLHERARRSVIDASAKYIPQALLLALAASVAGLLVTVLTTGGQSTVGK